MFSSKVALAGRYLTHWLNAVDQHSLQAPFVYEFYTEVINANHSSLSLKKVEQLRQSLLSDQSKIMVNDYGTGGIKPGQRSISQLARYSNQPKISKLLFNICTRFQPAVILELGTSLGLSTLSMAAAAPHARIITIEGCPEISKKAKENFQQCGAPSIELVTGDLSQVLEPVLATVEYFDLIYLDANHRLGPTFDYFNQCLPQCKQETIVVIDDIHWSPEMEHAWEQVKNQDLVKHTIDLFYAGVIFFSKNLTKKHYVLGL